MPFIITVAMIIREIREEEKNKVGCAFANM